MLSLCWAKNDVFLSGLASMPKRTRRFWVVGAMLGLCGPYVGPMLGSWAPCWGHLAPMLSLCVGPRTVCSFGPWR